MLLLLFYLLACFSLLILLFSLPNHRTLRKLNLPPGPKGLPLIGNLHQLDPSALHVYFSKLGKTYGPILSLRLGFRPTVVVQSAALAKEVLKTQDQNFCTRPGLIAFRKLSYNGLDLALAPYDDYYREMRKLCVVHLFSSKKVQSASPIRREEVSRMIQKIDNLSSESEIVNLTNLLMALTSSIICRVAFGKRYDDEGVEKSRFHTLLNEAEAMLTIFYFSDYFPFIGGWLDKFTGLSSRLERAFKNLDQLYNEIINDHLHPNKPKSDNEDMVDLLLQLRKKHSFNFDLTLDHIKAILMNIIAGGTDTSAITVVWAMTELMKNPTKMRKVQDELRTSIEPKSFIEENDISNLTYLKAVVKETFRLHAPIPLLIVRETLKKCTIKGYDILPKTLIFVNEWAIGRELESWKEPEKFIPERFIGSSIDFKGQDFELIPFGAGRRICPGMLLGVANVEIILANLLYSFNWELPVGLKREDIDEDVIPGIAVHKKNPLCLLAKKFSPTLPHE